MWDLGILLELLPPDRIRVYFKQWMYIRDEGLRYDIRDGHLDYQIRALSPMNYDDVLALIASDVKKQYLYWDAVDTTRRVCRVSLCSTPISRAYLQAGLSPSSFGNSWTIGKIPERYI